MGRFSRGAGWGRPAVTVTVTVTVMVQLEIRVSGSVTVAAAQAGSHGHSVPSCHEPRDSVRQCQCRPGQARGVTVTVVAAVTVTARRPADLEGCTGSSDWQALAVLAWNRAGRGPGPGPCQ